MQVERWRSENRGQKSDRKSTMHHMDYRRLDVYQRAHALFPKIYRLVRTWNQIDQREIGSQIIRAANSIHANIAEGSNKSVPDFRRYMNNAIGSCDELVSHINDAIGIGLINSVAGEQLVNEYRVVGKQLTRLRQHWK